MASITAGAEGWSQAPTAAAVPPAPATLRNFRRSKPVIRHPLFESGWTINGGAPDDTRCALELGSRTGPEPPFNRRGKMRATMVASLIVGPALIFFGCPASA